MGTLTVRENFYFSAALRLPLSISWNDKKRRVEKTIADLGLTDCADTKVSVNCRNILLLMYTDWYRVLQRY